MEGLTRLVTESLARHGFDRPLDYRRLQWSRWFRCDSHHSLLLVPSKAGVFALAEEITHVTSDANPSRNADSAGSRIVANAPARSHVAQTANHQAMDPQITPDSTPRRMLAVSQFFETDDMAFVLGRMLSHNNPMRARMELGRYYVRFVAIEDLSQRKSIANALNQWILSSAERATGIGSHFASSLELTPATEFNPQPDDSKGTLFGDAPGKAPATNPNTVGTPTSASTTGLQFDSAAANVRCPLPSGF